MSMHRILIVDDEVGILNILSDVAKLAGFSVKTAGDYKAFKEILLDFEPLIVMQDLNMPDAGIDDFLQLLKETAGSPQILLMSGVNSQALRTALNMGKKMGLKMIEPPLEKPFDIVHMEKILQDLALNIDT